MWGATYNFVWKVPVLLFQSTLPVWGATLFGLSGFSDAVISIHAPRVGSDRTKAINVATVYNFNPRSPCGERPRTKAINVATVYNFNPRSPCGERPLTKRVLPHETKDFNPRSPCGERHLDEIYEI